MTFDPEHLAVVPVSQDFAAVVVAAAAKENRTFAEQLLQFAIEGAEHSRLCKERK